MDSPCRATPRRSTPRVKKREEQSRDRSRRCNCPLETSGQVWDRNKEYLEFAYVGNSLRNWQRTNRKKRRRKGERRNVKGIIIRNRFVVRFAFIFVVGRDCSTYETIIGQNCKEEGRPSGIPRTTPPLLFWSLESCFVPVDRSNGDTSRINRV